jgi:hypothetical protein
LDLNQRTALAGQIYSLVPLTTRPPTHDVDARRYVEHESRSSLRPTPLEANSPLAFEPRTTGAAPRAGESATGFPTKLRPALRKAPRAALRLSHRNNFRRPNVGAIARSAREVQRTPSGHRPRCVLPARWTAWKVHALHVRRYAPNPAQAIDRNDGIVTPPTL